MLVSGAHPAHLCQAVNYPGVRHETLGVAGPEDCRRLFTGGTAWSVSSGCASACELHEPQDIGCGP